MARLATGIQGFDPMVQGGLPAGSSIVLQGPPGQEKLQFALTFLAEGLKAGASGLVLTSSQSSDAVLGELRNLGVDLQAVANESRLRIVDWYSWSEQTVQDVEDRGLILRSSIDLTNLGVALSRAIASLSGDQPRRAVIELLSPAMNVYELAQVYAFAQSAKKKFDRFRFTSLVLLEKDMHSEPEITSLLQPFDGVIEIERIRSGDQIVRKIGVLHMKETTPDPTFRVLEMAASGMRVVRESAKPSAPVPAAAVPGTVLESQEERARRLTLIMQIASERLKMNPRDADAHFAMAAAQATLDDPRGGLQSLDRLAELDPSYPGLWVLKTKLHARLGEADRARQSRLRAQQAERPEAAPPGPTVPCPMCEAPVAADATVCGNCGVKFAPVRNLEEELEDLGHAAIQEMVQEEFREGTTPPIAPKRVQPRPAESVPPAVPSPKPDVPAPPKPSPKPTPKKGLTNGLVLQRGPGRRTGRTNGLEGRTNGLRGRTNGLTNGLGRTNGLTNGVGRTNGLTNGLGRTNGLTNGLGRTNGLTNGLGRTNGITNGLGRTKGLTNGLGGSRPSGFRSSGFRGMMRTAGWKLYVIPLVVVGLLLMPLFFVPEYNGPSYPIRIDGQFGDWSAVPTDAMAPGSVLNPNVDVVRFGVVENLGPYAFYVEVAGAAFAGGGAAPGTMDAIRILVDIDGSAATGYRIDGFGADRMIEISGYGGAILTSTLFEFDSKAETRDWNGWIKGTATPSAVSGSQIEAQAEWLPSGAPSVPVLASVHTSSWDRQSDVGDFPVSPSARTLSVVADSLVPDVVLGNAVPLLRLALTAHGQAVPVDTLQVQLIGTAVPTSALSLRLMEGTTNIGQAVPTSQDVTFSFPAISIPAEATTTLSVVGDFTAVSGETVGVRLPPSHPFGLAGHVVGLRQNPGPRAVGYLGIVPSTPAVDGAFDEWTAAPFDAPGDVSPRPNPDIDLVRYAGRQAGGATFLYANVSGRLFNGIAVPEGPRSVPPTPSPVADSDRDTVPDSLDPLPIDFNNDGTPDAQTNGDYDGDLIIDYGFIGGTDYWLNTTLPSSFPAPYAGLPVSVFIGPVDRPPALGEDAFRIFLDLDNSTTSGYAVGGIGADRLVEIRGKDGGVTQAALLAFSGSFPGEWAWSPLSPVTVALNSHAVELSVSFPVASVYVESGDFWGSADSTTTAPALAPAFTSFKVSTANQPLSVPWIQVGPQPLDTLIDGGSRSVTTIYNHQRKVVRARVAGGTACDATNSGGCWYTVFYDQVRPIESDFKDGTSVAVPTALGLLDSLATTLATGDNLIVVIVQFDNTGAAARRILAGDFELRRGTQTTDPLVSQTEFEARIAATGAVGDGMFVVLLGKDTAAPANPTYGVFGAADATGMNAEVKMLVLNGFATGDSAFADGASVALAQASTTNLGSLSTPFPASSASLSNLIIAAVQIDSASAVMVGKAGFVALRRGTLSSSTVIASNQFEFRSPSNAAPDGYSVILVAADAAGAANQAYSAWAQNDDSPTTVNAEAKILAFRGLSASSVDTASVSIGTTRTVIGSASTTFAVGDDVIIGAIQLDALTSTRTIAAGADDIRLTGGASGSSNEFPHVVGASGFNTPGAFQAFVRKVTTAAANPSYEGAATSPAVSALNGELKLLAIHVKNSGATVDDRIVIMRSSNTGGSTWGSQIVLASGNSADSPLLLARDSSEPSIAIDSAGFLHLVWVSASAAGDQSTLNLVRYTRTTVAYPTQSQLASGANWETVTNVDDTSTGFMPTVSTDSGNNPHIAWSGSRTSGTVYYKNKAAGTIALDAATSFVQDAAATSFSFPHTTSGSDRILIVGVAIRNDASQTVSSVTYAGAGLTFLRADSNGASVRTELWYKIAPATGANTVVVTLSASVKAAMGAISLTGVDQSSPVDAKVGATGTSATPSATVTTMVNNAWVIDAVGFRSTGNGAPTGTAGAGQTERWTGYTEGGGTTPNIRGKGSTEGPKSPGGSVVMDWSLSASADWSSSAASLKPAGIWRATVSWGTTYTGISVDVSPQNNYVSLARFFDAATDEIQYTVCKNLAISDCNAAAEFTMWDGTAGADMVVTAPEVASYPSLAHTFEANGDVWVAYAKDVDGTTRAIYARYLDYPSGGWQTVTTVDSLSGTIFTRPSIGIDVNNDVHALYVATSGPQLYYNKRSGGVWGTRVTVGTSTDNPSLMVRAPNDATYGTPTGGLYWKTTTSETYFYIPEFDSAVVPVLGVLALGLLYRRKVRGKQSADSHPAKPFEPSVPSGQGSNQQPRRSA